MERKRTLRIWVVPTKQRRFGNTSLLYFVNNDYALWTGKCENLSKYKHTRSLSLDGQVFVNSMTYICLKINRLQIHKYQV